MVDTAFADQVKVGRTKLGMRKMKKPLGTDEAGKIKMHMECPEIQTNSLIPFVANKFEDDGTSQRKLTEPDWLTGDSKLYSLYYKPQTAENGQRKHEFFKATPKNAYVKADFKLRFGSKKRLKKE